MEEKIIAKECFAYFEKNGKDNCNALNIIECENCPFYKERKEIINNPFYAYSYRNKERHKYDMKRLKINEDQVLWK